MKKIKCNILYISTKCGLLIAKGNTRVVEGRGESYYEIDKSQIVKKGIQIPKKEKWRLKSEECYYIEYRSKDECNVMIYFQKRTVSYADYKIGYYYVNINDVTFAYFDEGLIKS